MKATPLLLAILVGCQAPIETIETPSVRWLVDHGSYAEALRTASADLEADPGSAEASSQHRRATIAWYLSQARSMTFAGNDEDALGMVQLALELEPDNHVAKSWELKVLRKLGTSWLNEAQDLHSADKLREARDAYVKALGYRGGLIEAEAGLIQVQRQITWRDLLGEDYYDKGVRAISDWQLDLAQSRFRASGKYRPNDPRPTQRVTEVEREIANRHARIALQLEEAGHHAAARNDFRVALLLDPGNEAAEAGLARARIEAEADEFLLKGKMAILRAEFSEARKILLEGQKISVARPGMFDEALAEIQGAQVRVAYQKAIDLEHDFRYEAAIAKYSQILAVEDYYEDCRARMDTLEDYVRDAAGLYERVMAAEEGPEALQLLRQIELFWPEYKDIRKRIQVLEDASADSDA
jgi:tetratricopeptide (TPR) repeat protein